MFYDPTETLCEALTTRYFVVKRHVGAKYTRPYDLAIACSTMRDAIAQAARTLASGIHRVHVLDANTLARVRTFDAHRSR